MSKRGKSEKYSIIDCLGDYTTEIAKRFPDRTATVCADRTTSYRELDENVHRVANGLSADGLVPGDRVAFLGKNSDYYFEILFGSAKAGMVTIPLNWRLAERELREVVKDADPAFLFYDEAFTDVVENLENDRGSLKKVAVGDDYTSWRDRQSAAAPAYIPKLSDCVLQLYTSGTTGKPKGVRLTNRTMRAHWIFEDGWGDFYAWSDDESLLANAPVFHVAGTTWALQAFRRGAKCVVQPGVDVDAMLEVIPDQRITRMFCPPIVLNWMLQRLERESIDMSSLKILIYGASPISPAVLRKALDLMPGVGFMHHYGMTEMGGSQVCMTPDEHDLNDPERLKSCGRPGKGVEMRIVDPATGAELPALSVGEIELKSDARMEGYWRKPDETERAFHDGWYRTGDAGYVDEDGFLYIVDRIKDMIVTGGENVYPVEVENVLYEHDAVAMAAVIGVPDPEWGEAVTGVVQLKPQANASERELKDFLRQHIAGYKIPKRFVFVDEMPLTPSNKIKKHELRKQFS